MDAKFDPLVEDAPVTKMALVIGNSDYKDGDPVSGAQDADAMAAVLEQIDFEVFAVVKDKNLEETKAALKSFQGAIGEADVVVFFYSGHGFQAGGNNYLVPIGGSIEPSTCLAVEDVVQGMVLAPKAVKVIFLNACRTRKSGEALQGFAEAPPAPIDVLQAFAASPNQLAASGAGDELSPYTMALVNHIAEPGLRIGEFFVKVHEFLKNARQLPIEVTSGFPPDFCFGDPVFLQAEVTEASDALFVILNDEVVLDSTQPYTGPFRLRGGENKLALLVSNGKRYHNNHDWDVTEGWKYKVKLSVEGQAEWTFEDHEDIPFRGGPHHGGVFTVARANIVVESSPLTVRLEEREDRLWELSAPFWAKDQDRLYEQKISQLPLDKILDPQGLPNFGALPAATLSLLLHELLTTGKFLDQKIGDPEQTVFVVCGNKALEDLVEICFKDQDQLDERVKDFHASLVALLNREPVPFDAFVQGLNRSLKELAKDQFPPDDVRVWTAIEDRRPAVENGGEGAVEALGGFRALMTAGGGPVSSLSRASASAQEAASQDPLFQKRPDEFITVPIPFNRVVQGVPLELPAQAFLSLKRIDGDIRINARAVADLSDVQRKIGALIDTIPLPTDRCGHFSGDNVVARIWGKQITISWRCTRTSN